MKKLTLVSALLLSFCIFTASANDGGGARSNAPAHVRNILSTKLPARLQDGIKKELKNYWITELYQSGEKAHLSYTITVENPDRIIQMRSVNSKSWVVVSSKLKGE